MIAINNISQDLHVRFGDVVDTHVIDAIFEETLSEHARRATVDQWVPVLAGREAADRIAAYAEGTLADHAVDTLVAA